MTTVLIIIAILAFVLMRKMGTKGIKTITTTTLKERLNDKAYVFIDVRTKAEYKGRHIAQFKNMPLGSDYSNLPKDKEIVVICQSGMRSMQACKQLKKIGYEKITNVRGGMSTY